LHLAIAKGRQTLTSCRYTIAVKMLDSTTNNITTSATTTATTSSEAEDVTSKTLEADRIFVLMQKDYRLLKNRQIILQ
jgi:hypothetical protein